MDESPLSRSAGADEKNHPRAHLGLSSFIFYIPLGPLLPPSHALITAPSGETLRPRGQAQERENIAASTQITVTILKQLLRPHRDVMPITRP